MRLSAPIFRLKHTAKQLARKDSIPLHAALDRIAQAEEFQSWSHLVQASLKLMPHEQIYAATAPGALMVLGARPGHGKTQMGLMLAAEAARLGQSAFVFSLEYTEAQVLEAYENLGVALDVTAKITLDTSDDVSAATIIAAMGPKGGLAVVDYMQLLDQRRSTPPLEAQLRDLKAHAAASGGTIVLISQIDRHFDGSDAQMPTRKDIRLPNPADLSMIDTFCFLHDGMLRFEATSQA